MLTVKTFIGKSSIQGTGLFLAEPVKEGTVTWIFDPSVDVLLDPLIVDLFSEEERAFVERYGYLSRVSGLYVLCGDDSKFMNHSLSPTTAGIYPSDLHPEGADVAVRDLDVGEELTCNYKLFEKRSLPWLK
jgi:SET domain-containing protein